MTHPYNLLLVPTDDDVVAIESLVADRLGCSVVASMVSTDELIKGFTGHFDGVSIDLRLLSDHRVQPLLDQLFAPGSSQRAAYVSVSPIIRRQGAGE